MPDITFYQFLAILIGSGGAVPVLIKIIDCIKSYRSILHKKEVLKGLESLQLINDRVESIVTLGVDRVVLFHGHNGGGIPSPGNGYYTSAVIWNINSTVVDLNHYKNIPVDAHCISLLIRLSTEKVITTITSELPTSQLKEYLECERVIKSVFTFITIKDSKYYYLVYHILENNTFDKFGAANIHAQQIIQEFMTYE